MSIVKSGSRLAFARILSTIVGFIGLAYFSQRFGGAILGPFFLFQAILTITGIPVDFGIRGAVEKRISEGRNPGEVLASALLVKLPLLVAITVVIYLFRGRLNAYLGANLWLLVCLGLFLREGAFLSVSTLRGELRVGETAALLLFRNLSWVIVGIIFSTRGFGVYGPVYGLLFGFAGMAFVGVLRSDTRPTTPTSSSIHSLINYGKYKTISNTSWEIFNWTDVLLLGVFLGSTEVAAYEIAWRVSTVAIIISSTATKTVFPYASKAAAFEDRDKLQEYIRSLLVVVSLVLVPAFFGVLAIADRILVVAFSPEFIIAAMALVILMGQSLVQSIQSVFGQILFAIDRPSLPTRATVVAFVSNIILNLLLIPRFGLTGAAIATTAAYSINLLIQYIYITNLIEFSIPWSIVGTTFIASLLMYVVLELVESEFIANSYAELFGLVFIGVTIFGIGSLVSPSIRIELKKFVRAIR